MIFQGTSAGVSLQVPASNVIGIEELPVNAETCLALNRTYQELVLDSLQKIEVALGENRDRQVRTINTSSSHCVEGYSKPNAWGQIFHRGCV